MKALEDQNGCETVTVGLICYLARCHERRLNESSASCYFAFYDAKSVTLFQSIVGVS